jgi:hypothetical protein
MQRCINVPFTFKGKEYFAILRRQTLNNKNCYKIRIMNSRLDTILHKSDRNIIDEHDGYLVLPEINKSTEEAKLLLAVASELKNELARQGREHHFKFITDFRLLTPY